MPDWDRAKEAAGRHAADRIEDGQVVGLGSGTTAQKAVRALGRRVDEGLDVVGIPTSEATARVAEEAGVPLTTLEEQPSIDVTMDGADEVAPDLQLVKGLGGALVREKIVAAASDRLVILVDPRKLVDRLGTRSPLPVETVPFGHATTGRRLEQVTGASATLRRTDGEVFVSDSGGVIYDLAFDDGILSASKLAREVDGTVGVVEHGLFLDLADEAVVGDEDGSVEVRTRG